MTKHPYVSVDWRQIETVREGLEKRASIYLQSFSARDARHRKTLMELSAKERKQLVGLSKKLAGEIGIAAYFLCDQNKLADGFGLYDLIAASRHSVTDLEVTLGVNATYFLIDAPAELKTGERVRKYIDFFRPIGPMNTAIFLNIGVLERDGLNDAPAALATLREAIELGDPRIRSRIEKEAKWQALPGIEALASFAPKIPPGLRCLQMWNVLSGDEYIQLYAAGIAYFDLTFASSLSKIFYGVDDEVFQVFASSDESERWAFWKREPNMPLEARPVVVFGPEGAVGVYAASLAGMLSLLAHGWKSRDIEKFGYLYGEDGWTAPEKTLGALKPRKAMVKRLKEVAPDAMKLNPEKERNKALALMPALIAEATRRSKESAVRKVGTQASKPKPKQLAKDSPFELGFSKIPAKQWPADLVFLQSKQGKAWLRTFKVAWVTPRGELPELLQDLDGEGEDLETRARRAIRDVLEMVTFALEAPDENATLYGYWRGPEKTPLNQAPIISFDSEGTITREVGASLLDVLLQNSCYEEKELFTKRKAVLEKAGQTVATKTWSDYTSRGKWKSDPTKLHSKLYAKYRKEPA